MIAGGAEAAPVRWTAPARAAALNGAIVVALWVALTSLVSTDMPWTYPLSTAAQAAPFGALAAWRTWAYAKRWRGDPASIRPVFEAGAVALAIALAVLGRGLLHFGMEAVPYALFYAGIATAAGLLLGALLRATALLVLWRDEARQPPRRRDPAGPPDGAP